MHITGLDIQDVRFPTSTFLDGSDAMNPDPDYSAAYVTVQTDGEFSGSGHTFTIGRGTEVVVSAAEALRTLVVGRDTDDIFADMGAFGKSLTSDSQLRWIGPEKGAVHLATAAVTNAVWDLHARVEGKPMWRLLAELSPSQIVDLVDWRYLTDALDPGRARETLEERSGARAERRVALERDGYPAYITSIGWLGYDDETVLARCESALAQGWTRFKMKVGRDIADDVRRAELVRSGIGNDHLLAMDANQVWNVDEAIRSINLLREFDPWWIEEPTSPDDILGHAAIAKAVAPIPIATGEMVHNRVMFKQFLQAGGMQICQLDACRVAGVNEAIAVLLLADSFGVPVCPHAGGVGLCEYVQHLSMFDFVAVSGSLEGRATEYAGHLHEHFVDPVRVANGQYQAPSAPGYSVEMFADSIETYAFPNGSYWKAQTT